MINKTLRESPENEKQASEFKPSQLIPQAYRIAHNLKNAVKEAPSINSSWKEASISHIKSACSNFENAEKEQDQRKSWNLVKAGLSELGLASNYLTDAMKDAEKQFDTLHKGAIVVGIADAAVAVAVFGKFILVSAASEEAIAASLPILKILQDKVETIKDAVISQRYKTFVEVFNKALDYKKFNGSITPELEKEFYGSIEGVTNATYSYASKGGLSERSVESIRDSLYALNDILYKGGKTP